MKILVTGAAGFIGFHASQALLARGDEVVGVDNLNDYYDVGLKETRLAELQKHGGYRFHKLDLARREETAELFDRLRPEAVLHLAAQAGVRYSLENPHAYADANLVGFLNVLEGCRQTQPQHLVYASSSSVYGGNSKVPFCETDPVDRPVSLYAATKKANELLAHSYSHLYGIPSTGLRFFTVYGPWGRPDMAYYRFTEAILENRPIALYNYGRMRRDFTYIDDIVEGVVRTLDRPARPDADWRGDAPKSAGSFAPYRIFNIGNHRPVELLRFVEILEDCLGRKARRELLPMQPGDVYETFADIDGLKNAVGFQPNTALEDGLARFVEWYRSYHRK